MNRRRALMVFSGAFEFKREHNKEIEERENDSEELISIMKKIEEHERNIAKPPTDQVWYIWFIFSINCPRRANPSFQTLKNIILAFSSTICDQSSNSVLCSSLQYWSLAGVAGWPGHYSQKSSTLAQWNDYQNPRSGRFSTFVIDFLGNFSVLEILWSWLDIL